MKRMIPLSLIVASAALLGCQPQANAMPNESVAPATISVNGSAAVEAVPDRVQVRLNVERTGKDIPALKEEVDAITAELLSYLASEGIAKEDIQSYAVRINPKYRYDDGEQILLGYQVSRRVVVDFDEADQHSAFLEFALDNGVQRVEEPQYSISNADGLYEQALAQAVANARSKADKLAAAAGVTITGVRQVNENSHQAPVARYRMMAANEMGSADVSLPGQQSVNAQVHVVFEISAKD
ncbi:SIMPL domain-containing protein [Pseudidiomarina sediminum]|uniref:SIMPL domain-containing protein n=1 Tax=Pseudidiomarina sediminum TaxID=431675 RepID=A0A432Z3K0_9GAMM|nr:SIMPL domain-containing protein [Pseudidiomarina sediminum]RUO72413.1 SIMPL domain-containing protein [Pseudidiomarina sediminum]